LALQVKLHIPVMQVAVPLAGLGQALQSAPQQAALSSWAQPPPLGW